MPDQLETEILQFFKTLNQNEVRFILVGGVAVNFHGFSRTTADVDVWLTDTEENRKRFVKALADYGIEGADVYYTMPFIAGYTDISLDSGMTIDIMCDLQFFKKENFEECYWMAHTYELAPAVNVKFLAVDHLIKELANSPEELDQIEANALIKLYQVPA